MSEFMNLTMCDDGVRGPRQPEDERRGSRPPEFMRNELD